METNVKCPAAATCINPTKVYKNTPLHSRLDLDLSVEPTPYTSVRTDLRRGVGEVSKKANRRRGENLTMIPPWPWLPLPVVSPFHVDTRV
jgi:hypothetical protein